MEGHGVRAAGRPKDPEKRSAIIDAAGRLFLELGFERATMDAIAAAASVSKLTLYSHFADKEGLFRALIAFKCGQHFEGRDFEQLTRLAPREAITRLGNGFVGLMYHPDVLAMYRVLVAGAKQDPRLNRAFYESGPAPTIAGLAQLLAHYDRQKLLRVPTPQLAADHLLCMLQGCAHFRALLNVEAPPSSAQLKAHVRDCVDVFLSAYAPARSALIRGAPRTRSPKSNRIGT